jgi:hypothetical protein
MSAAPLQDGPLAIIGDVHGELDALEALLHHIDELPGPKRAIAFVGDLTDRGPNSPGVLRRVRDLIDAGRAQLVLGNHELNLLRMDIEPRADNAWLRGERREVQPGAWLDEALVTSDTERSELLDMLADIPVALERNDLAVVHASWDPVSLATLTAEHARREDARHACKLKQAGEAPAKEAFPTAGSGLVRRQKATQKRLHDELRATGLLAAAREREAEIRRDFPVGLQGKETRVPPVSPEIQKRELKLQNEDPLRVLTSGREAITDAVFAAGGKWRHTRREPWWQVHNQKPVAFGHYWRQSQPATPFQSRPFAPPNPFENEPALGPVGPAKRAFCLDYSVGRRFLERLEAPTRTHFEGRLAALIWPEAWTLFDDGTLHQA